MTQEEKNLLLKDLLPRLQYEVKIQTWYGEIITSDINTFPMGYDEIDIEQLAGMKPYLRPMSSMTEEERNELAVVCGIDYIDEKIVDFGEFLCEGSPVNIKNIYGLLDWLNKKMFDYRSLIEKGLALEALEDMYFNNELKLK